MSKIMDYLVKGGDGLAMVEAQLEHALGHLESALEDERKKDAEIERLRAALKPFAEVADDFDADGRELKDSCGIYANTAGDFRRAREALRGNEQAHTGTQTYDPDIERLLSGIREIDRFLTENRPGDASFVCEALLAGVDEQEAEKRP